MKFSELRHGEFEERSDYRRSIKEFTRLRGTERKPEPPRDLMLQAGSRKVLVTWKLPVEHGDIAGWRVYKDTESNLYSTITDKGQQQEEVALSAGGGGNITTSVFVSSFNILGSESARVQVIGAPTVEAAAPADPAPPAEFVAGSDTGYYGWKSGPDPL